MEMWPKSMLGHAPSPGPVGPAPCTPCQAEQNTHRALCAGRTQAPRPFSARLTLRTGMAARQRAVLLFLRKWDSSWKETVTPVNEKPWVDRTEPTVSLSLAQQHTEDACHRTLTLKATAVAWVRTWTLAQLSTPFWRSCFTSLGQLSTWELGLVTPLPTSQAALNRGFRHVAPWVLKGGMLPCKTHVSEAKCLWPAVGPALERGQGAQFLPPGRTAQEGRQPQEQLLRQPSECCH